MTIGFVGQGFIGKNYADDFEHRGFSVTRYALEEPYVKNKEKIKACDIVFIAVPTPTTPEGFSAKIVAEAVSLVGKGAIAVIKSTIIPGTTMSLQKVHPDKIVLYSPEFLSEATAAHDAAHPFSNIVGIPEDSENHRSAAESMQSILPKAPFSLTCTSTEAELIKYSHNLNGYFQIILSNLLYDLAQKEGARWEVIQEALEADPLISNRYLKPVHKSGRGAGGNCFIKDFAAFTAFYREKVGDERGMRVLESLAQKNTDLLLQSGKDIDLLRGVYGEDIVKKSSQ